MSSSHLFLDLPITLFKLYFELSSGFHMDETIKKKGTSVAKRYQ